MNKPIPTRLLIFAIVIMLTTTGQVFRSLAQTTSSTSLDPFNALPESELVMVLDVRQMLNEAVPRILSTEPSVLAQMNAGLDMLKDMGGIDARSLNRIIIGARSLTPAILDAKKSTFGNAPPPIVMIAQGIEAEKLLTLIRSTEPNSYREENYQGKTLYTILKKQPAGMTTDGALPATRTSDLERNLGVVALDATTLAFGTLAEVRASIDASAGRATRVNPALIASATRQPSALFSSAFNVPPTLMASLMSEQKPGNRTSSGVEKEIFKTLSSINHAYTALSLTPTGFNVVIAGRTAQPEQAKSLSDMLTGLRALALHNPPKSEIEKTALNLLENLHISADGAEFQITADIPQATVNALVQSAQQMTKGFTIASPKPKPKQVRRGTRRRARRAVRP